jgi:hypothetical protein
MLRDYLLLFLILGMMSPPGHLWSQTSGYGGNPSLSKTFREAETALLEHKYKRAAKLFEECLRSHPNFAAAHRGLGLCHDLMNEPGKAAHHYERVIELDSMFSRTLYFLAGEAHYKIGEFDKALDYFERFAALKDLSADAFGYRHPDEPRDEERFYAKLDANKHACRVSLDSTKFLGIREVVNLGEAINTRADEYFPFLSNDQRTIIYTRRRHARADEDLYYSTFSNGAWQKGLAWNNFNSSQNEGMSTLVRNGRKMYFTACGREGVRGPCDIWEADVERFEIKSVGPVQGTLNSDKWESQATISCDGTTMYFASNREGGYGGTDIWMSRRLPSGAWSDPVNLGPTINTPQDEESPFITNDGRALYFASTGHPGMGEQDIFVSFLDDNQHWTMPVNLGPPVNSPFRELGFFLSADGRTGYFSSNRPGGFGDMDIYKFELPEQLFGDPITFVEGIVRDSLADRAVPSAVYLAGRDPLRTDEKGRFFLCLPAETPLEIRVSEADYHPYHNRFTIPRWDNRQFFTLEIILDPLRQMVARGLTPAPDTAAAEVKKTKVEKQYTCTLFFGFDSYRLDIDQTNRLDDFIKGLDGKEIARVEIVGYADDIGADEYNLRLSEERAKNIALFMREYGIIVHKVYLEGRGAVKDDKPKDRNRRVEIKAFTLE